MNVSGRILNSNHGHKTLDVEKAKLSPFDFFEEVLSESDFVRQLQPEEARNLALASDYADYPADSLIFSEGDKANDMYFIVLGLVQVFVENEQQEGLEIKRLSEGDYFGEQGFLAMNKGLRTASVQTLEPTRLLKISGELFEDLIAKNKPLKNQLETIGREQQEIRKKHRQQQLLNRLVQSRSSVSLTLPRASGKFSSICLAVDAEKNTLELDEVISEYRNPIQQGDVLKVTGSISGTPLNFKTEVLEIVRKDNRPLYVCSFPEVLVYVQQRHQFRLGLGVASRAEVVISIDNKRFRGAMIDISEGGLCFRLPAKAPVQKGDIVEKVKLSLDTRTIFEQAIEILNTHAVVHSPTTKQIGARFKDISTEQTVKLRDYIKEAERRRLRNVKNA